MIKEMKNIYDKFYKKNIKCFFWKNKFKKYNNKFQKILILNKIPQKIFFEILNINFQIKKKKLWKIHL